MSTYFLFTYYLSSLVEYMLLVTKVQACLLYLHFSTAKKSS